MRRCGLNARFSPTRLSAFSCLCLAAPWPLHAHNGTQPHFHAADPMGLPWDSPMGVVDDRVVNRPVARHQTVWNGEWRCSPRTQDPGPRTQDPGPSAHPSRPALTRADRGHRAHRACPVPASCLPCLVLVYGNCRCDTSARPPIPHHIISPLLLPPPPTHSRPHSRPALNPPSYLAPYVALRMGEGMG